MIKIWGWEKKPRTMLRYLKIGDIFCFQYDEHTYRTNYGARDIPYCGDI